MTRMTCRELGRAVKPLNIAQFNLRRGGLRGLRRGILRARILGLIQAADHRDAYNPQTRNAKIIRCIQSCEHFFLDSKKYGVHILSGIASFLQPADTLAASKPTAPGRSEERRVGKSVDLGGRRT